MNTLAPSDLLTMEVFWSWTDEVLKLKSPCGFECVFAFVSQVGSGGHPVSVKTLASGDAVKMREVNYQSVANDDWPGENMARGALEEFLRSRHVNPLRQSLLVEAYVGVVRQFLRLLYPYFNDQTPHHYSHEYAEHCVTELRSMARDWTDELGLGQL